MIIGNPYEFAICLNKVEAWSGSTSCEGLFDVVVGGVRLTRPVIESSDSLDVTIHQLKGSLSRVMKYGVKKIPNFLSHQNGITLLSSLILITYPKNVESDNCWDYVISPDCMTDKGFHLFVYERNSSINIIGGNSLLNIFGEAILGLECLRNVASQLDGIEPNDT